MKRRLTCSNSNTASAGEAGFSLFEMLVALVLMVGILAALSTITAQWLPNWNRGFHRVQRTELLSQGLERLVADIAAAQFITSNGRAQKPLFYGDELGMRFVRTAFGPNTRPGLEVVRIATVSTDLGLTLVRDRRSFVTVSENGAISDLTGFADPVVLIRQPYRIFFSYAGPDNVWQNDWKNADQLPAAVRILVRDGATQRTLAVSTVSMLRVTAAPECARAKSPKDCIYPQAASRVPGTTNTDN